MKHKIDPTVPYTQQLTTLAHKRALRVEATADPNILTTYNPWAERFPCTALLPDTRFRLGDRVVVIFTGYFALFQNGSLRQAFPIYHMVCPRTGYFEINLIRGPVNFNGDWQRVAIAKL